MHVHTCLPWPRLNALRVNKRVQPFHFHSVGPRSPRLSQIKNTPPACFHHVAHCKLWPWWKFTTKWPESVFHSVASAYLFTYVNGLLGACLGSKESRDDYTHRVNIAQATLVCSHCETSVSGHHRVSLGWTPLLQFEGSFGAWPLSVPRPSVIRPPKTNTAVTSNCRL